MLGRDPVVERWRTAARSARQRVVLADGNDGRAVAAAQYLDRERLMSPVLLDDPAAFCSRAVQAEAAASSWSERIDLHDPLHVAALMVAAGEADACVGGASRPTADVVRAALFCIGPAPGVETISSCFVLVLPDGATVTYGDCGVVPEPDPGQLASIAISTAATHEALVGETARVALLSYSTKGSAGGLRVERVRSATEIVRAGPRRWPSTGSCSSMRPGTGKWPQSRPRARRLRAGPTCSSSRISTRATSPTRSPNGWAAPERTGRCCRAPHGSFTTCHGAAMRTTSSPWP